MQTEKVVKHIVNWLKDYANNAKVNGFVVGISGGIDSAVTSTLCAETDLKVLCIEMPIHQAVSHVNRAQEHIKQLKERYDNVDDVRVDLTPVFEEFKTEVSLEGKQDTVDMALANTRARLRMTTWYYHAGLDGLLVAGTGNKVEDFGVGFYTKYGDGGVDLSPIGDLYKTEVRNLGRHIGILQEIVDAAPTDGLWDDDRTDEDQLGLSYEEIEGIMEGKCLSEEKTEKYLTLRKSNSHKMLPIPVFQLTEDLKNY